MNLVLSSRAPQLIVYLPRRAQAGALARPTSSPSLSRPFWDGALFGASGRAGAAALAGAAYLLPGTGRRFRGRDGQPAHKDRGGGREQERGTPHPVGASEA
eukprot:scaffold102957_cov31-Tisochrysis_lutea.AAC.3